MIDIMSIGSRYIIENSLLYEPSCGYLSVQLRQQKLNNILLKLTSVMTSHLNIISIRVHKAAADSFDILTIITYRTLVIAVQFVRLFEELYTCYSLGHQNVINIFH
jgi:hypothetical protein